MKMQPESPTNKPATGTHQSSDPMDAAASAVGHLYEAKERLKDAATAAGGAVRSAASTAAQAARADLGASKEGVTDPLHDAATAGRVAASEAKDAVGAEFDVLVEKGKGLWSSAESVVRQHPLAAFGTALAVGWLVARATRRG